MYVQFVYYNKYGKDVTMTYVQVITLTYWYMRLKVLTDNKTE